MLRNFPSDPFWEFGPPPPLPSLRKFSGSAHDPAILVHYMIIYLYFVGPYLKSSYQLAHQAGKFRKFCLQVSVAWPASPISYSLQDVFFFGSFTCLRWCGESLLPLFVHFITAYWRRLARRSNFGAYEL